jgi:hypothetical protein
MPQLDACSDLDDAATMAEVGRLVVLIWQRHDAVWISHEAYGDTEETHLAAHGGRAGVQDLTRPTLLDALLAACGEVRRKPCSRCGVSLPLEQFKHDATRRDGLFPYCRTCCSKLKSGIDVPKLERKRPRQRKAVPMPAAARRTEPGAKKCRVPRWFNDPRQLKFPWEHKDAA